MTLACIAAVAASAYAYEEAAEDGDARLGFITVGSNGVANIAFNSTSIQNAVILGLFLVVLGALLLPLYGVYGGEDTGYGGGYGYESGYQTGYEEPHSDYGYHKRSVGSGPVLDALAQAHKKYEEDEE